MSPPHAQAPPIEPGPVTAPHTHCPTQAHLVPNTQPRPKNHPHPPPGRGGTLFALGWMFAIRGGVFVQWVWGAVAGTRSIGVAWAWSGLTLLLGIPLYWIARRSDPHLDRLDD